MIGTLPHRVEVNGVDYEIRTDYRDILNILVAFNDPELEDAEKVFVCLHNMFPDFLDIPDKDYPAAFTAALSFIDCGRPADEHNQKSPRVMDWEQDESLLFPAVNKAAGFEVRATEYLHWWTFMGYYMEISDGVFSQVLSMRTKKAKGKPLEKWEKEYWRANKSICVLATKKTADEKEAEDNLKARFGSKKKKA